MIEDLEKFHRLMLNDDVRLVVQLCEACNYDLKEVFIKLFNRYHIVPKHNKYAMILTYPSFTIGCDGFSNNPWYCTTKSTRCKKTKDEIFNKPVYDLKYK